MNETIQKQDEKYVEFTQKVASLIKQAKEPITDQASLIQSGNAKIALESYVKAVKAHFEPEMAPIEERIKLLKNKVTTLLSPAKLALDDLVSRQRAWMAQEKSRAEAETKRRQDELIRESVRKAEEDRRAAEEEAKRKRREAVALINQQFKDGLFGKREYAKRLKDAGADEEAALQIAELVEKEAKDAPAATVRVAPSIPAVAGVKNQTYYYVSVHNPQAILTEISDMILKTGLDNSERFDFLRRFLTVDASEVGKYAREMKNPNAVMAALPGVRAWSNG